MEPWKLKNIPDDIKYTDDQTSANEEDCEEIDEEILSLMDE